MKEYGMKRFEGKCVFVTGGAGYIGSELAERFVAEGARVCVADLDKERIDAVCAPFGGQMFGVVCDVSDSEQVDAAIAGAVCELGGLDILVHCAGGSARSDIKPLVNQSDEVLNRVLGVNLYGALYTNRAAARYMAAEGKGGRIINISSAVGLNGLAGCADYAAAKGGVIAMSKALAKELGGYGITVNCACFGVVRRPDVMGNESYGLNTNFLGKQCTAADCAALVAYLASEEAGFVTGANYVLDGGRTLAMKGTD